MTTLESGNPAIQLLELKREIDRWVEDALPPNGCDLHDAMRHASCGGKRLRGQLVIAAGQAVGNTDQDWLRRCAVAVEFVHAYSLVHDDLPAMDDDDVRHGKPTVHRQWDEATAILAGDALLSHAFAVILGGKHSPQHKIEAVALLAEVCGPHGMVLGQSLEQQYVKRQETSLAHIERVHSLKTGALFLASIRLGALDADKPHAAETNLKQYGKLIGIAFQIRDDLLDYAEDQHASVLSYPHVFGREEAEQRVANLWQQATTLLKPLGDAAQLLNVVGQTMAYRAF